MSNLRGSNNYIWFESDVLGQGATGAVYKARHKRTGEVYAVKTFNHMGQMRPMEVQMREFQVLQKVNHENIVKLLAIEEDTLNNNKVIIMELCTGGSLYNLLEEPSHSFGVDEQEFFNVLGDVASGLKHLRELGVVHRDIKPGNIMLFNADDGRHIYKLTDFGAARELDDEEQFMSLYGTEEYLYPDMYARAVLRRPSDKRFDASVDLWSLGVTLYHVATGHLPFRPFGGRSNKHTMYQMTGSKESGVISGIQHEAGGTIEYSRELPRTCPLSEGAKLIATPLLAGLMECKEERMWTFDRFFEEVHRILKRKTIYVFNTYDGILLHVFVDPDDKLLQFQEAIAKQTSIPANHQDLILDRDYLTDRVTHMLEARKYPVTSPTEPLFLFYKHSSQDSWDFPPFLQPEIPKCPISSNQVLNVQIDYTQAKTTTGILHHIKRKMGDFHKNQKLIALAAKVFLFLLCNNITRLQTYIHQFTVLVEETQKRMRSVQTHHDQNVAVLLKMVDQQAVTNKNVEDFRRNGDTFILDSSRQVREVFEATQDSCNRIDDFHARIVKNGELAWEHIAQRECKDTDKCQCKIVFLLDEMELTVKNFRADKKKRTLSHNEEQIHKFERHKVKTSCEKAVQIANTTCCSGAKHVFKNFADWFKWSSPVSHKLRDLEEHMANLTKTQATISQKLDAFQFQHTAHLDKILSGHQRSVATNGSPLSQDIEQEYVVYNSDDAPVIPDIKNTTQNRGTNDRSRKKSSIRTLKGQIVSLKSDTDDIQRWLQENTGLLQELKLIVDES